MITKGSIDLKSTDEKCFARVGKQGEKTVCLILSAAHEECGTYKCPFYKPSGCADWVRLDGRLGAVIVPPEEYR